MPLRGVSDIDQGLSALSCSGRTTRREIDEDA
jgi:hypothetical protein